MPRQKSAVLKWYLAHDYLLPIVMSHIKILNKELKAKALSEDERYDIQIKIEAWKEIKFEMS